jgi:hypothetical protein
MPEAQNSSQSNIDYANGMSINNKQCRKKRSKIIIGVSKFYPKNFSKKKKNHQLFFYKIDLFLRLYILFKFL